MNSAAAIVVNRARDTDEFRDAIKVAEEKAAGVYHEVMNLLPEKRMPYMKEHGGWTEIIKKAFDAAAGDTEVDGSEVFGKVKIKNLLNADDVQGIYLKAMES